MYVLDTDKHHHPHIHIRYNEFKAVLKIPAGEVLEGDFPSRQMKLGREQKDTHFVLTFASPLSSLMS